MKCYILNPKCSGYIDEWKKLIPHIKKMGFDTIHLLPINAMGYSQSPYAINNHFLIDPAYDRKLSTQDAQAHFDNFVLALKKNDIDLCIDLVLNHVSIDHVLLDQHPEWAQKDDQEPDGFKRAGWQGETWNKWKDLALLDYDNNIDGFLWQYMRQYALTWANYAALTDGYIRLDNFHSCNQAFLDYVLTELCLQFPNVKKYTELFADHEVLKNYTEKFQIDYLLGTSWEHKSTGELTNFFHYIHNNDFRAKHFAPVNSQDSASLVHEFGSIKALAPRMASSALLGTGSWGFYQGTELALDEKIPFVGEVKLSYFREALEENKDPFYMLLAKQLNEFIAAYSSFFVKGNICFFSAGDDNVICAVRRNQKANEQPAHIYIFINFDFENEKNVAIAETDLLEAADLPLAKRYKNLLTNEELKINGNSWNINLAAGGFSIFAEK